MSKLFIFLYNDLISFFRTMSIKAFKLLFLCLRAFAPQREQVILILKSHLASKAVRVMNKFVGFSSIAGVAAHCWEALEFALKGELFKNPFTDQLVEGILVRIICFRFSEINLYF
jgi:hypothetical protein